MRAITQVLKVRCCCQPQKILGTMEVPIGAKDVTCVIRTAMPFVMDMDKPASFERLTLPVAQIITEGRTELAVKAEGVGLDVLRNFITFREIADG